MAHMDGQLIFNKAAKLIHREKNHLFNKQCWYNGINLHLAPVAWTTETNIKLVKENRRKSL